MPCQVDAADDGADRREINRLTRMLCHIAGSLEAAQLDSLCLHNAELRDWVADHRREDLEKVQQQALKVRDEKRRSELLAVLSWDDKRVLGIH